MYGGKWEKEAPATETVNLRPNNDRARNSKYVFFNLRSQYTVCTALSLWHSINLISAPFELSSLTDQLCCRLSCHARSITQTESKNEWLSCNSIDIIYIWHDMLLQTVEYLSNCLSNYYYYFTIMKHWKYEPPFSSPIYKYFSCLVIGHKNNSSAITTAFNMCSFLS